MMFVVFVIDYIDFVLLFLDLIVGGGFVIIVENVGEFKV